MNRLDELRNEPKDFENKELEVERNKKNLFLTFFILDFFIFLLIAALFDWIDFIKKDYLIFGSVFFIAIFVFYIIAQIIKMNSNKKKLND